MAWEGETGEKIDPSVLEDKSHDPAQVEWAEELKKVKADDKQADSSPEV